MADSAILAAGGANAPLSYKVPGAAVIRIKQVHVHYTDNGAVTDWLPMVRIVSDSGHTMGQAADQAVKVTAGDDAAVTFHPGVKHGAATPLLQSRSAHSYTVIGQVIPTGVSTAITFDAGTIYSAGSLPLHGVDHGTFFDTFTVAVFRVGITLAVLWPVGAYDRYIEIVDPAFFTSGAAVRYRTRTAVTPDGDLQVVTALIDGSPAAPKALGLNAFQASGVNKTISRWMTVYQWPEIVGQGGWPG